MAKLVRIGQAVINPEYVEQMYQSGDKVLIRVSGVWVSSMTDMKLSKAMDIINQEKE